MSSHSASRKLKVLNSKKNPTEGIFFGQKEKDKYYEDERQRNLEKIREKYTPMDFSAIKEHEQSFLANAYMKKQQREQELKSKMKSIESAYKPQLSQANLTKGYKVAREDYLNNRHANPQSKKIAESMESRDRIKKYNDKLRLMNAMEEPPASVLTVQGQSKLNSGTASRNETGYGRFGREWTRKIHQHEEDQKQLEVAKEKGMEYLRFGKSKALKKDERTLEEKMKEEAEEKRKETVKTQEIGREYLKFARSKAAKDKVNPIDMPVGTRDSSNPLRGEEKAFVRARLEKMDGDILKMESKIRNKMIAKDSVEIETAYLNNIKAKLSLLEEI